MGKHYDGLNESQRQQVDATFELLTQDLPVFGEHRRDQLRERLSNLALACAPRNALTDQSNVYQELTEWQREQVDATQWILSQFCPEIDGETNKRKALTHLSNLVLSCAFYDEVTRAAFTLLLDVASQTNREGEIVTFVASTAIGRHVLEKRSTQWQELLHKKG